jgi:hypothetical protein
MGALGLILVATRAFISIGDTKKRSALLEGVFKTDNKAGVKTFFKN